jgi:hypothetical protein
MINTEFLTKWAVGPESVQFCAKWLIANILAKKLEGFWNLY